MTLSIKSIIITVCLLFAYNVGIYFQSKGLGDVKQYLINIEHTTSHMDVLMNGNSSKRYFYALILFIAYTSGFSASDILSVIGIASYASMLFMSYKIGTNRIGLSARLANVVLVTSPFFIYFFMSNIRSGLSFTVCFSALYYFRSNFVRFILVCSAVVLHKIALALIFYYLLYSSINRIFGRLPFLAWFILSALGASFIVISLMSGFLPLKFNFEPWGAGSAYSLSYMIVLFSLSGFFWTDNALWFSALSSTLLAFFLFIVDIHAVRFLSLAGVLCSCGVLMNNGVNFVGKYIMIFLLSGLSLYHYYLIIGV